MKPYLELLGLACIIMKICILEVLGLACIIIKICSSFSTTSHNQHPCPPGTYNNVTMATNDKYCLDCTPGMFCEGHGLPEPSGPCDGGYYCSGGSWTKTPLSSDLYNGTTCPLNQIGESKMLLTP